MRTREAKIRKVVLELSQPKIAKPDGELSTDEASAIEEIVDTLATTGHAKTVPAEICDFAAFNPIGAYELIQLSLQAGAEKKRREAFAFAGAALSAAEKAGCNEIAGFAQMVLGELNIADSSYDDAADNYHKALNQLSYEYYDYRIIAHLNLGAIHSIQNKNNEASYHLYRCLINAGNDIPSDVRRSVFTMLLMNPRKSDIVGSTALAIVCADDPEFGSSYAQRIAIRAKTQPLDFRMAVSARLRYLGYLSKAQEIELGLQTAARHK